MSIALIILKIVMFTVITIAPILIGRELFQAARGKEAAPVGATAPAEDKEAA